MRLNIVIVAVLALAPVTSRAQIITSPAPGAAALALAAIAASEAPTAGTDQSKSLVTGMGAAISDWSARTGSPVDGTKFGLAIQTQISSYGPLFSAAIEQAYVQTFTNPELVQLASFYHARKTVDQVWPASLLVKQAAFYKQRAINVTAVAAHMHTDLLNAYCQSTTCSASLQSSLGAGN